MNKDLLASSFASALGNSLHRSETESALRGTLSLTFRDADINPLDFDCSQNMEKVMFGHPELMFIVKLSCWKHTRFLKFL